MYKALKILHLHTCITNSGIFATSDLKVEIRPRVKSFNPLKSGPQQQQQIQGTNG